MKSFRRRYRELERIPLSKSGAGELTLITTATRMVAAAGLTVLPPLRDPPSAEGLRGSGGGPLLQQRRENSASVFVQPRVILLTIPQVLPLP